MRTVRSLGVFFVGALFLLVVPMASAHTGTIAISCSEVTFSYTDFPNHSGNTVTETITVDGQAVPTPSFTFDGPTAEHTVPINVPAGGAHDVAVHVQWNTNGAVGHEDASQTLTGCASPEPCPGAPNPAGANANGDAYGAFVQSPLLNIPRQPVSASSQSGIGANHQDDSLLTVQVPNIARINALLTISDSRVTETPSQAVATSTAETARVNLFKGAITADVVRATAEAIARGDGSAFNAGGSGLVNLRINGIRVLGIRPNLKIKVPSIGDGAYVVLFERIGSTTTPDAGQTNGGTYGADVTVNMIHVHVPPARAGKPPIDVIVSHARAHADFPQTRVCTASAPASVSGYAYVASTTFDHPALPLVVLGYEDIASTGGAASQGLAELFIPKVLTAGVATSSSVGVITADASKSTSKAAVANVNLLDGQITATVVQSQSNSRAGAGAQGSTTDGTQLLDIAIAGKHIANNPPANTKYELPGIGYVMFNETIPDGAAPGHTGLTVRAIHLHANRLLGVVPGSDVIVAESHSDATH